MISGLRTMMGCSGMYLVALVTVGISKRECGAQVRIPLSHRTRVKRNERIAQSPTIRPGSLSSARHVQDELENIIANLLNSGLPRCDPASINVDQIVPFLGQGGAR